MTAEPETRVYLLKLQRFRPRKTVKRVELRLCAECLNELEHQMEILREFCTEGCAHAFCSPGDKMMENLMKAKAERMLAESEALAKEMHCSACGNIVIDKVCTSPCCIYGNPEPENDRDEDTHRGRR
jgi:hypothetical protein